MTHHAEVGPPIEKLQLDPYVRKRPAPTNDDHVDYRTSCVVPFIPPKSSHVGAVSFDRIYMIEQELRAIPCCPTVDFDLRAAA